MFPCNIGREYIFFLSVHAVQGINECTHCFCCSSFITLAVKTVISDSFCVNIACLAAVRCMTNCTEAQPTPLRLHLHFRNVSSQRTLCTLEDEMLKVVDAHHTSTSLCCFFFSSSLIFFSLLQSLIPPVILSSLLTKCSLSFPSCTTCGLKGSRLSFCFTGTGLNRLRPSAG